MFTKIFFTLVVLGVATTVVQAQVASQCNVACPFIYMPVCASNDLTYANKCVMESMSCVDELGLTLKHEGACAAK